MIRPLPPARPESKKAMAGCGIVRTAANSSLRKRMRAIRRGIETAIEPNEKALLRHGWYRRAKAWAELRKKIYESAA